MTDDQVHLHSDDYPDTLRLLAALLGSRSDVDRPGREPRLGYEPTEHGAFVSWERLTTSAPLSSTEVATVHIARGTAIAERAGGLPPSVAQLVLDVVQGLQ